MYSRVILVKTTSVPCTRWTVKRSFHDYLKISRLFPFGRAGVGTDQVKDSASLSHRLLKSHGITQPASVGSIYLLPGAVRALEKLVRLIDRSMHSIGAQKVSLPCLAPQSLWKQSGRWDDMGEELFRIKDRQDSMYCLSPTHEEAITSIVASRSPVSYKPLPLRLYQIGKKYRDEPRPKSGLLRCKEFEMKDLYTFDESKEKATKTYHAVCDAYENLFTLLDLDPIKVLGDTGAMGGVLSHEYQLASPVGEDNLLVCSQCGQGFNSEMKEESKIASSNCTQAKCPKNFDQMRGIEIAHCFLLGTKYSETFKATFSDSESNIKPLIMGCYGIGSTRLLASSVEVLSVQSKLGQPQLVWPRLIAPYQVCIIPQSRGFQSEVTDNIADNLHRELNGLPNLAGEVVLDDRVNRSIGKRLKDAKLSGFPYVIVVGKRALGDAVEFELVDSYSDVTEYLSESQLFSTLKDVPTVNLGWL